MEINSYAEYAQAKRVYKDVEIKNVGENYDVYVQGDTLWLADVFEDFWNMSLEIYGLDPVHFLSAKELGYPAALKKAKVKLDLLNELIDMLLIVEKGRQNMHCCSSICRS